jgi:hypothetical protein
MKDRSERYFEIPAVRSSSNQKAFSRKSGDLLKEYGKFITLGD